MGKIILNLCLSSKFHRVVQLHLGGLFLFACLKIVVNVTMKCFSIWGPCVDISLEVILLFLFCYLHAFNLIIPYPEGPP